MGLAKLFEETGCCAGNKPSGYYRRGQCARLDAKMNVDGNALYRQQKIAAMDDPSQEDEREAQAAEYNQLCSADGNIGCMVNGVD